MSARPARAIIIGMDGMIPEMLLKFSAEGLLPNLTQLLRMGSFSKLLPSAPTDTPTNWSCLSTGASAGVHGAIGFNVHYPGEPLDLDHSRSSRQNIFPDFLSIFKMPPGHEPLNQICQAEHIWESAQRCGKKTLLVNWPGGWPPTTEHVIAVDGSGPFSSPLSRVDEPVAFVAGRPPASRQWKGLQIREAQGWRNAPLSQSPPLESAFLVSGEREVSHDGRKWRSRPNESEQSLVLPTVYHLLLWDSRDQGYDHALVCRSKDATDIVAELCPGATSPWLEEDVDSEATRDADGYTVKDPYSVRVETTLRFRLHLAHLSPDADRVVLYRTALYNTEGWAHPLSVAYGLLDRAFQVDLQSFIFSMSEAAESDQIHPPTPYATVHEPVEAQTRSLAMTSAILAEEYSWDLLMVQVHAPDSLNHNALGDLLEDTPIYEPSRAEVAWQQFRQEYQILDAFVGDVIRDCADDKTLVVCVSDHGCLPARKAVWMGDAFMRAGLTVYIEDDTTQKLVVDWDQTKALLATFPWGHGVWVNLKGRDPDGIVEPGSEYEAVRTEAINALLSVVDPETGQRPIALALRREDAPLVGLGGERVPDCVFYFAPGYCDRYDMFGGGPLDPELVSEGPFPETNKDWYIRGMHHCYLPTATYGGFSNSGILVMKGPGIKRGYRRTRSAWTFDVAPTIAHLLDMPFPAQTDGGVIADVLSR